MIALAIQSVMKQAPPQKKNKKGNNIEIKARKSHLRLYLGSTGHERLDLR